MGGACDIDLCFRPQLVFAMEREWLEGLHSFPKSLANPRINAAGRGSRAGVMRVDPTHALLQRNLPLTL